MSELMTSAWAPRGAWTGYARAGRHGRLQGEAGIRLTLREGVGLATLIAGDGQEEALRAILSERYGWNLPEPGATALSGERGLVWSGPGQWLAVAESGEALRRLPEALRGLAAVTDQSDARAIVRVSGPRARAALAKGVTVDLHPRAFGPGRTAVTSIAHIGAQLWQVDAGPSYDVAVARSFAGSFWSWLADAAAEFGYEVRAGA
ncbi:sarcosine oxidase subunit gamma family protein [Methylobacterium durans]|uniref:sarcosine oxidase subunit gamma n=1 Tax=Methylobacterium durans TaxID=2202825 RepID=UPI002AFE1A01|nr:sarcosine oxidase subunit gamma family protein [Methylobacterium durans]MEA1833877.1 sarcosine oxidase subunit gamma family protein [Methylobacterium durans]